MDMRLYYSLAVTVASLARWASVEDPHAQRIQFLVALQPQRQVNIYPWVTVVVAS